MAATDRASGRRRRLLLGAAGLVAVAVAVVALVARGAERADEGHGPPPLPVADRADLDLVVEARRDGRGLGVSLVLGVVDAAEADLRLVDWGGAADGWSRDGPWADGPSTRRWIPAVREERRPGGQVVLHVGAGPWAAPEGIPPIEPRVDRVRSLHPGEEVGADVRTGAPRAVAVRVCVWAAGADPDDPGDRPAACADDRVAGDR